MTPALSYRASAESPVYWTREHASGRKKMCGIFAVQGIENPPLARKRMIALSKTLRHRGPDWSGCYVGKDAILVHERLAIVGVDTGAQPLINDDGTLILCVNGEIYNHVALRKGLKNSASKFKTHSDCEVIHHLPMLKFGLDHIQYKEHDPKELCNMLDGMFSFILLDESVTPARVIAARDPIGITTLYQGWSSKYPNQVYFASELKALVEDCDRIISFPPGHVYDSQTKTTERYFNPTWWNTDSDDKKDIPTSPANLKLLRETLEAAVRKRLMSEVPYGVLLSGGLDSSLIASIAARETEKVASAQAAQRKKKQMMSGVSTPDGYVTEEVTILSWPQLHSFSIGLPHSPDLLAARKAAAYLGTVHHEYTFTVQEGLDAIPEVIYHLETYDVTTVRASTPMYLLSRKIKAMGVKMVLSGEGSDEILGGYLYFHAAPDSTSFHQECVKRVKNLHTSDCLRANKSTMAWGLEARVPFLDKSFLEVAMNVDPKEKMFSKGASAQHDADGKEKMEKLSTSSRKTASRQAPIAYHKRQLYHNELTSSISHLIQQPYLPPSILWRQKEQFSDGVGYSWIDGIKDYAATHVSDEAFDRRHETYPEDTPDTKEGYYIRETFESHFPSKAAAETAVRWIPRGDWGCAADPSGRSVAIHNAAYSATD
ncbi:asparagine synthetase [Tulasnella sp. 330]|nr:asparagine synthetase [Tulasnella sp. 330]